MNSETVLLIFQCLFFLWFLASLNRPLTLWEISADYKKGSSRKQRKKNKIINQASEYFTKLNNKGIHFSAADVEHFTAEKLKSGTDMVLEIIFYMLSAALLVFITGESGSRGLFVLFIICSAYYAAVIKIYTGRAAKYVAYQTGNHVREKLDTPVIKTRVYMEKAEDALEKVMALVEKAEEIIKKIDDAKEKIENESEKTNQLRISLETETKKISELADKLKDTGKLLKETRGIKRQCVAGADIFIGQLEKIEKNAEDIARNSGIIIGKLAEWSDI